MELFITLYINLLDNKTYHLIHIFHKDFSTTHQIKILLVGVYDIFTYKYSMDKEYHHYKLFFL